MPYLIELLLCTNQPVLLKSTVDLRMFLKVLEWIRRTAQGVRHGEAWIEVCERQTFKPQALTKWE